jgi:hypothetical protein
MKKLIQQLFLLSGMVFLLAACKKESAAEKAQEILPGGTALVMGSFTSNAHQTTGTVKIVRETSGKRFLVFENFRTDNGPDLRVWLSPNTTASPYTQIGTLKAISGNFSYELSDSVNYTTNNRVLIWCEDFSVLFGNAVLQ